MKALLRRNDLTIVYWYPDPPAGYDSFWDSLKRWWNRRRGR